MNELEQETRKKFPARHQRARVFLRLLEEVCGKNIFDCHWNDLLHANSFTTTWYCRCCWCFEDDVAILTYYASTVDVGSALFSLEEPDVKEKMKAVWKEKMSQYDSVLSKKNKEGHGES